MSCDGHIYFFTTETLRKVYEMAGFEHAASSLCRPFVEPGQARLQRGRDDKSDAMHQGAEETVAHAGLSQRRMKLECP